MNWFEAAAVAIKNRIHIRRESWPSDKWIFCGMEPIWIVFPNPDPTGKTQQVVRCTDFGVAEFLATDWTTVPAPLTSCPVTPTEPIGGGPPVPGFPGFPTPGTPTGFPPAPGGGGGNPPGPSPYPPLPTPDPGTGISVTLEGISVNSSESIVDLSTGDLDNTYSLEPSGPRTWMTTFPKGNFQAIDVTTGLPDGDAKGFIWVLTVQVPTVGIYNVTLQCTCPDSPSDALGGGFGSAPPNIRGFPMPNTYSTSTSSDVYGGTATVS